MPRMLRVEYPWSSFGWHLAGKEHRPAWMCSEPLFGEHGITRDDAGYIQGSNRTNAILYVSVLICWEVLVNFRHAAHVTRRISGCDLLCHEPGQSAGGCFSG